MPAFLHIFLKSQEKKMPNHCCGEIDCPNPPTKRYLQYPLCMACWSEQMYAVFRDQGLSDAEARMALKKKKT
jgi:hypothetical protein